MKRSHEEILADLQASPAEIRSLSPKEQILHPNCPIDLWWELLENYGYVHLAVPSPLFPLVLLDTPDRWMEYFEPRQTELIRTHLAMGHGDEGQRFVVEQLWKILPLYEAVFPVKHNGLVPCIEARAVYAREDNFEAMTWEQLHQIWEREGAQERDWAYEYLIKTKPNPDARSMWHQDRLSKLRRYEVNPTELDVAALVSNAVFVDTPGAALEFCAEAEACAKAKNSNDIEAAYQDARVQQLLGWFMLNYREGRR